MRHDNPDLADKLRRANNRLSRHKKRSTIALALLFVLNAVLLMLVVSHLWDHPWAWESVRQRIP